MPLLEHNGFELSGETQAILRYLDRVLPEPSLTPADPRAAARMDQAMNINDWYLFQGVNNIIGFQRVIGPAVFGLTPDEAVIRAAVPQGRTTFCELSRLLADQRFLRWRDAEPRRHPDRPATRFSRRHAGVGHPGRWPAQPGRLAGTLARAPKLGGDNLGKGVEPGGGLIRPPAGLSACEALFDAA